MLLLGFAGIGFMAYRQKLKPALKAPAPCTTTGAPHLRQVKVAALVDPHVSKANKVKKNRLIPTVIGIDRRAPSLASRSLAEKSVRNVTAEGMARILLAPMNQNRAIYGIWRVL
jgi:hypothetical protein